MMERIPMPLVSVIWTWQEGERIYSRLTTNVPAKRLLAKLSALKLLDCAGDGPGLLR